MRSIVPLRCILVPAMLLLTGCGSPDRSRSPADLSLSVDDILARSEAAYTRLKSLDARGWLRDFRPGKTRVQPIRWEFLRADLCRLQIGMDMTLVKGRNWWSYDHETGRFKSHRELSPAPMEAAAYFLSDGIPFILPVAWNRPQIALGPCDIRSPWRLDGFAWSAGRPCYVVSREGLGRDSGSRWNLWIDQDRFLIVAWTWDVQTAEAGGRPRESTIWGCTYEVIEENLAIAPDRFRIEKPSPIVLPRLVPSENTPGR